MSLLTDVLGLMDEDRITTENVVDLGKAAWALFNRVAAVAAAQGMTEAEWIAAVGLERGRLDAWLAATNAAEDKALRDG